MTTHTEAEIVAGMDWMEALRTLYAIRDTMSAAEREMRRVHPECVTPVMAAGMAKAYCGAYRDIDLCLQAIERDLFLIDEQTAGELAVLAAEREKRSKAISGGNVATS